MDYTWDGGAERIACVGGAKGGGTRQNYLKSPVYA